MSLHSGLMLIARTLRFAARALPVFAVTLIASTRLQAQVDAISSLTPASAALPIFGIQANVLSYGNHNVFFERLGGMNPSADYLRVVGESLDLVGGGTTWSFASSGEHYNVNSPGPPDRTLIPKSNFGPFPPSAGVRVPDSPFYLAFTQTQEKIFPFSGTIYSYGWVQFVLKPPLRLTDPLNASNDLILLGGAITGDPRGIVVGQYRVVPEPSAGSIVMASLAASMAWRRRRS